MSDVVSAARRELLVKPGLSPREPEAVPRALLVACLLTAFALPIGGAFLSAPRLVGLHHDDAVYAITARALAEGRGYRLTNLPGDPPQTKYPPLLPALLASIWRVTPPFPANLPWLTLVPAVGGGACAAAAFAYGQVLGLRPAVSLLVALASVSVPYWVELSGSLMSETLFTAFALGALAMAGSQSRDRGWAQWSIGALFAAAALTRTVGVAVVAGALAGLCYEGRLRWRVVTASIVPVVVWQAWCAMAAQTHGAAAIYYTNYFEWFREALGLDVVVGAVIEHIAHFTIESALMQFDGLAHAMPFPMRWPLVLLPLGSLFWAAGLVGCRRDHAALGVLVAYMALVLVWPWPIGRFLLPMFPIVWLAGASALLATGARAPRQWLVSIVAGVTLVTNAGLIVNEWRGDRGSYRAFREVDAPRLEEYDAMYAWIRQHVPPDAVVGATLDSSLALYTGRKTTPLYALAESGGRFVVRSPVPEWMPYAPIEKRLADLIATGELSSVYRGKDPRFEVLAVTERAGGATSSAGRLAIARSREPAVAMMDRQGTVDAPRTGTPRGMQTRAADR